VPALVLVQAAPARVQVEAGSYSLEAANPRLYGPPTHKAILNPMANGVIVLEADNCTREIDLAALQRLNQAIGAAMWQPKLA
jgi:hypothetical protein